jgi:hypothetical protein
MKRSGHITAALLLGVAAPFAAIAQGASTIVGGLHAMHVEERIAAQSEACSRRFPESASAWATALQASRDRQQAAFRELRDTVRAAAARESAARPGARDTIADFGHLVRSLPHAELGALNDAQAGPLCQRWLVALAPDGALDRGMPELLSMARRLQPQPEGR